MALDAGGTAKDQIPRPISVDVEDFGIQIQTLDALNRASRVQIDHLDLGLRAENDGAASISGCRDHPLMWGHAGGLSLEESG
jgi:hypothetical protein